MNDERFLSDWLKDEAPDGTDARAWADRIMARLPRTRQRSRWWPFAVLRRPQPRPEGEAVELDHTRRTRIMITPAKAIAAGALVFAIGGALFVSQNADRETAVPGGAAETERMEPSLFSGQIHVEDRSARGGWQWTAREMTDPRLEGKAFYSGSEATTPDGFGAGWQTMRIVNDDGAWQASFPIVYWGDEAAGTEEGTDVSTVVFHGEGAYDGLVAVTHIDLFSQTWGWDVTGVVLDERDYPEPAPPAEPFSLD